jgi:hypothetical protein
MYELVYFNWRGTNEEFIKSKEIVQNILTRFDDVDLIDVLVPSSEWNYVALYKSKDLKSFLDFQREMRKELHSEGFIDMPRKLELLVDLKSLY